MRKFLANPKTIKKTTPTPLSPLPPPPHKKKEETNPKKIDVFEKEYKQWLWKNWGK